jgi:hypothetical protein
MPDSSTMRPTCKCCEVPSNVHHHIICFRH